MESVDLEFRLINFIYLLTSMRSVLIYAIISFTFFYKILYLANNGYDLFFFFKKKFQRAHLNKHFIKFILI